MFGLPGRGKPITFMENMEERHHIFDYCAFSLIIRRQ